MLDNWDRLFILITSTSNEYDDILSDAETVIEDE